MKQINRLLRSTDLLQGRRALFAGLAALAVAVICSAFPVSCAAADEEIKRPEAVAQIDQLLADFHGALSYGGNIDAMMALWADGSTLTLNGTAHAGKNAIKAFFLGNGYFLNNWVSLAPEFKTQITVNGDHAEATTQCVATDISVTPPVVRGVIQANITMERRHGQWFFTAMNNTTPAPL